jgi:hypothetical protein
MDNQVIGLNTAYIPMVGPLAGAQIIPVVFTTPLKRNPRLLPPIFIKNSPDEDDVAVINVIPSRPNDLTFGWSYKLAAPSVAGQILAYSYIL